MLKEVRIKNYKSIDKLKLELGRVTILIGENGCGKSNILEAIALASAENQEPLNEIKKKLKLIDWFQDFEDPPNLSNIQNYLQIKDRYLDPDLAYFDQRSSNGSV